MPHAHHEIAQTRSSLLRQRAQAFCAAFLDLPNNPPDKLLAEHFTPTNPQITEHGPGWASKRLPFLGKTFASKGECLEYFRLLAKTLEFIPHARTFPLSGEGFVVDDQACVPSGDDGGGGGGGGGGSGHHGGVGKGWDGRGVVSVVGQAKFRAVGTGREWEEEFCYRLSGFDEEGRIGHWEVWADPLSAWVAVGGEEGGG
ncbi:hypothetical protein B0A55_00025 [Friedmanniomyces simplex]|uniref:SnoaL-like domain-containing protein n=1 Tax=Friedmanniomyces simplex TaxID=329884 RepID=A0A4U0Y7V9_9PEZI|nr:hypothetical protein B0A55_00025 [Friedmanniomyces simplex]